MPAHCEHQAAPPHHQGQTVSSQPACNTGTSKAWRKSRPCILTSQAPPGPIGVNCAFAIQVQLFSWGLERIPSAAKKCMSCRDVCGSEQTSGRGARPSGCQTLTTKCRPCLSIPLGCQFLMTQQMSPQNGWSLWAGLWARKKDLTCACTHRGHGQVGETHLLERTPSNLQRARLEVTAVAPFHEHHLHTTLLI